MQVRIVMTTPVVTIPLGSTYEDAARILYEKRISGAPVVDEQGRMVGLVSDKDLYRVLYPWYKSFLEDPVEYTDFEAREAKIEEVRTKSIEEFMTRHVFTVDPSTPVMKAGAMMLAHHIHRLPVVEHGKLVGLVTRQDIYRKIVEAHLQDPLKK